MIRIKQFDEPRGKGAFTAYDEQNTQAAQMTYAWAGEEKFIIDHTEVDERFGGQGLGKKLVLEAVAFARKNELKIIPLCPFAKSVFQNMPELADVLH